MADLSYTNMKLKGTAWLAIQEAAEIYLINLFGDTCLCTTHAEYVMIQPKNMQFTRGICGETTNVINPMCCRLK